MRSSPTRLCCNGSLPRRLRFRASSASGRTTRFITSQPVIPNSLMKHLGCLKASREYVKANAASGDGDGLDVAVFRFTLGIPGFDDRLIPRVVGGLGVVLLGVNHLLGEAAAAQERTEFICALLCAVLVVAPWLEDRLREARPGRGRRAVGDVPGTSNCFHLAPDLDETSKKELAWASYALLLNANCCGFILADSTGRPLCVRGALSSAVVASNAEHTLNNVNQALSGVLAPTSVVSRVLFDGDKGQVYVADRAGMAQLQLSSCAAIAEGIESVLLQRLESSGDKAAPGLLVLLSERARGLSERDCLWAEAIAKKLSGALATSAALPAL